MTSILVGTKDGIYTLDAELPREPAGHRIDAIQRGDGGWWILSNGSSVWFQADAGEGHIIETAEDARLNCLLPVADEVLLGAAEAQIFRLSLDRSSGGIASAGIEGDDLFAAAPGRDQWFTPWGGPPDVRSMDRDVSGTIYVNVHVGGILRFQAEDPVWRDTMDIRADVHEVIAHPEIAGTALAATARGLAISRDAASTWSFHTDALHAVYCRAVAASGDRVFVSASRSNRGEQAAVYRTDLTGAAFERCGEGLPEWFSTNVNTGCLATEGDLVIIGDTDGAVYRSVDGGEKWDVAADGLPGVTWVTIGP